MQPPPPTPLPLSYLHCWKKWEYTSEPRRTAGKASHQSDRKRDLSRRTSLPLIPQGKQAEHQRWTRANWGTPEPTSWLSLLTVTANLRQGNDPQHRSQRKRKGLGVRGCLFSFPGTSQLVPSCECSTFCKVSWVCALSKGTGAGPPSSPAPKCSEHLDHFLFYRWTLCPALQGKRSQRA